MDLLKRPISQDCYALVFYGIAQSAEAGRLFLEGIAQWMEERCCPPDKLGFKISGRRSRASDFQRQCKKLGIAIKNGNLENAFIVSLKEGSVDLLGDYIILADWSAEESYAMIVARSSIMDFSSQHFGILYRFCVETFMPAYGIAYHRKHEFGPIMYALGIVQSPVLVNVGEAYEEERNISRWCDMAMPMQLYRQGILRDVYPLNFLSEPHLRRPVGKLSLEEWIRQDLKRGSLERITEEVVLWKVADEAMPGIRADLNKAKVIFQWRDFAEQEEAWRRQRDKN